MKLVKRNITPLPSTSEDKMYRVVVKIDGNPVFYGKLFKLASQTSADYNLTDILTNYVYRGYGICEPTYDYTTQSYTQTYRTNGVSNMPSNQYHRIDYSMEVLNMNNASTVFSTNGTFYPFNETTSRYSGTWKVKFFDTDNKPIPHLPNTSKLRFAQPFWNGVSNTTGGYYYKTSSGYGNIVTASSGATTTMKVLSYPFSTLWGNYSTTANVEKNHVYTKDNNTYKLAAILDTCVAPYYLVWMDDDGAMQCQRFTSRSVETQEYTRNNKVNMDDCTDIANMSEVRKWKLKSYNLTDEEYRFYLSIARSPYVILYDSARDESIFVNLTDKSYEWKKMENNKNKPTYMEITVTERYQKFTYA